MAVRQFVMSTNGVTKDVDELCGWTGRPVEKGGRPELVEEAFDLWSSKPTISAIMGLPYKAGGRSMLWEVGRKLMGTDSPNYPQEIGDCVSFGAKNACEYLQYWMIANGVRAKWTRVFPP